jgi:hypothetical protein
MKARLLTFIARGTTTVTSSLTRAFEPVARPAAIGDGASTPAEMQSNSGDEPKRPEETAIVDAQAGEGAIAPIEEERRKNDRRRDNRATTLDTRKGNLDRRTKGRISLKV